MIKPAIKQMTASSRIARISSNFTEPGMAAVIGSNEQSADQRGFDKISNRSHLGPAPNTLGTALLPPL
jgi:hypothetical protein